MLPISLDCPFLIVPSVFSNVYKPINYVFPYQFVHKSRNEGLKDDQDDEIN